ncbi:Uncharacterized protein DBV15_12318 [Temnothorax longispinosus]|uniref:Uncharacterized protein n=1 Tax=Temnothorax longispinosus TaxID=300112 RepID=A0A4S2L4V0_9HYME|nr:Uncharacterized protein DBV15_12318 [Temnothorax longispinosus]
MAICRSAICRSARTRLSRSDIAQRRSYPEVTLESVERASSHSWGIFFTILGTVLLNFDADACQSPARAYLLDVTVPETGIMLGGHVHATFTLITIIFVVRVICTITSFKEIPLQLLERNQYLSLIHI